jgi:hypothetical protein
MTLSHHVAVITSDEQALIVASDLAEDFKRDSALRDRERRLPHPELEVFSRSGLWGISVPKEVRRRRGFQRHPGQGDRADRPG